MLWIKTLWRRDPQITFLTKTTIRFQRLSKTAEPGCRLGFFQKCKPHLKCIKLVKAGKPHLNRSKRVPKLWPADDPRTIKNKAKQQQNKHSKQVYIHFMSTLTHCNIFQLAMSQFANNKPLWLEEVLCTTASWQVPFSKGTLFMGKSSVNRGRTSLIVKLCSPYLYATSLRSDFTF